MMKVKEMKTTDVKSVMTRLVAASALALLATAKAGEKFCAVVFYGNTPYAFFVTHLGANTKALGAHRDSGVLAVGNNLWKGLREFSGAMLQGLWDCYDGAASFTRMEWIDEQSQAIMDKLTTSGEKALWAAIEDDMIGAFRIPATAEDGRYEFAIPKIEKWMADFASHKAWDSMDIAQIAINPKWLSKDAPKGISTFGELLATATHPAGQYVQVKDKLQPAEVSYQGGARQQIDFGEVDEDLFG